MPQHALKIRKLISIIIILCFFVTGQIGICPVFAQIAPSSSGDFLLPAPGVMVHLSPEFNPPILKGIKVHPDNPFNFDFILDKGDSPKSNDQLKEESSKLIKYFLASLTIPENDLWVNLSPYEKDRIIPPSFGLTEMGRDLLAEDYMLKQITASLIYPEDEIGKKFWKRIYEVAQSKYHTTNIPVNTFNKVWIVPEKAVVYENAKAGTAYVLKSTLKVMLEQDYLSLEKHSAPSSVSTLGSQVVREIVIPELTKEVNQDKNFARLRQVYNSLILATWYKKKIKESILSQVYVDKNKVSGVNINDPKEKEKIYQRYLKAFKKGVYNYIKEDMDPISQQMIPRKYFSGGVTLLRTNVKYVEDSAQVSQSPFDDLAVVKSSMAMTSETPHQGGGVARTGKGKRGILPIALKEFWENGYRDDVAVEITKVIRPIEGWFGGSFEFSDGFYPGYQTSTGLGVAGTDDHEYIRWIDPYSVILLRYELKAGAYNFKYGTVWKKDRSGNSSPAKWLRDDMLTIPRKLRAQRLQAIIGRLKNVDLKEAVVANRVEAVSNSKAMLSELRQKISDFNFNGDIGTVRARVEGIERLFAQTLQSQGISEAEVEELRFKMATIQGTYGQGIVIIEDQDSIGQTVMYKPALLVRDKQPDALRSVGHKVIQDRVRNQDYEVALDKKLKMGIISLNGLKQQRVDKLNRLAEFSELIRAVRNRLLVKELASDDPNILNGALNEVALREDPDEIHLIINDALNHQGITGHFSSNLSSDGTETLVVSFQKGLERLGEIHYTVKNNIIYLFRVDQRLMQEEFGALVYLWWSTQPEARYDLYGLIIKRTNATPDEIFQIGEVKKIFRYLRNKKMRVNRYYMFPRWKKDQVSEKETIVYSYLQGQMHDFNNKISPIVMLKGLGVTPSLKEISSRLDILSRKAPALAGLNRDVDVLLGAYHYDRALDLLAGNIGILLGEKNIPGMTDLIFDILALRGFNNEAEKIIQFLGGIYKKSLGYKHWPIRQRIRFLRNHFILGEDSLRKLQDLWLHNRTLLLLPDIIADAIKSNKLATEYVARLNVFLKRNLNDFYSHPIRERISFNSIYEEAKVMAKGSSNVEFSYINNSKDGDEVFVDQLHFREVLLNMFENAKYVLAEKWPGGGGKIKVTFSKDGLGNAVIEIEDNGTGIPQEYIEKVFDLYFTSKGDKGTGFGLFNCKKIVEAHGGTLEVKSEAGVSTTFTIKLPLESKVAAENEKPQPKDLADEEITMLAQEISDKMFHKNIDWHLFSTFTRSSSGLLLFFQHLGKRVFLDAQSADLWGSFESLTVALNIKDDSNPWNPWQQRNFFKVLERTIKLLREKEQNHIAALIVHNITRETHPNRVELISKVLNDQHLEGNDIWAPWLALSIDRIVRDHNESWEYEDFRLQTLAKAKNIMESEDRALLSHRNEGGINLSAHKMHLEVQNAGASITFKLNPAMLAQLQHATGFIPKVISIEPMTDLKGFLGIKEAPQAAQIPA